MKLEYPEEFVDSVEKFFNDEHSVMFKKLYANDKEFGSILIDKTIVLGDILKEWTHIFGESLNGNQSGRVG